MVYYNRPAACEYSCNMRDGGRVYISIGGHGMTTLATASSNSARARADGTIKRVTRFVVYKLADI